MNVGCDSSIGLVHEPTHSQKTTRMCGTANNSNVGLVTPLVAVF